MSTTPSSPRLASSPPPSISPPTTTTTTASANALPTAVHHIHPTLPSAETQRHVAEARAAVVASMGNMVDRELQSRAGVLHENARALERQERDVVGATAALRKEREKLGREADAAARRLKEVGNVQNWAEVLEREFLVLEETVRLANGEDSSDGEGSCSCSCSECGRDGDDDDDGDERRGEGGGEGTGMEDGPDQAKVDAGVGMMAGTLDDAEGGVHTAWSDTSRSLNEPESSTGTGMAKGSETASISTAS